jgi:hypothetical protein
LTVVKAALRALYRCRWWALGNAVAVVWLTGLAIAFLSPVLARGDALGPYDLLHALGLTHTLHPHVHNPVDSDEIQEFIPWQVLAWRQVHAGQVPLWDPFNLLGMPYGFNFESAPFGLTTAIGYAFPLALSHTATVASRLVLAGTGAFVCGRVLRLPLLAAVAGGTVFELSGALTVWDGTFRTGAYCFIGWVLAASVALLRGRRRIVTGVCLALALALVLVAGDPQVDFLVLVFLGIFVAVVCSVRLHRDRGASRRATRRTVWRACIDHLLALVAACALAAPAYLPSAQLLARSARASGPYVTALPTVELTHLIFAGYDGVATTTASQLGSANVFNGTVYVGGIALVLALCALAWWRWRPEVVALTACTVLAIVALFAPPVVTAMRHLPELKVFSIDFATTLLDYGLAMLSAFGVAALARNQLTGSTAGAGQVAALPRPQSVRDAALRLLWIGVVVLVVLVAALGIRLWIGTPGLTNVQARVRAASFLWPSVSVGASAVVGVALIWVRRREPNAGNRAPMRWVWSAAVVVLLLIETAFLFVSGAWTGSSTSSPLVIPRPVARIAHAAGGGLVGIGSCVENAFPDLGVMPNANILYGLKELTEYDPIIPNTYYSSYGTLAHTSKMPLVPHVFCPAVTSTRIARFYGVSDVLEPAGGPALRGATLVASVGGESLYAVAGSSRATLVPLDRTGGTAAEVASASGQRLAPSYFTSSGALALRVDAQVDSLLVLRVTDVPGWHATIDGRPIPLHSYGGVLMAARVPSGRHIVQLTYWPSLFRDGLFVSLVMAVAIVCLLVVAAVSRRRRRGRNAKFADLADASASDRAVSFATGSTNVLDGDIGAV